MAPLSRAVSAAVVVAAVPAVLAPPIIGNPVPKAEPGGLAPNEEGGPFWWCPLCCTCTACCCAAANVFSACAALAERSMEFGRSVVWVVVTSWRCSASTAQRSASNELPKDEVVAVDEIRCCWAVAAGGEPLGGLLPVEG